jgi:hypothetical protein
MYINQEQPREITGSGGCNSTLSVKFLDTMKYSVSLKCRPFPFFVSDYVGAQWKFEIQQTLHIQGVPGGMNQTSGGCSLG